MRSTRLATLAFTALCFACASTGTTAKGGIHASAQDTIVASDLTTSTATTLYSAIKEIRPLMLTGHGRGEPEVYIGTTLQANGLDRLNQLRPGQVSKVIYLSPADAEHALGAHSEAGVLVVTLAQ
jgi:hypothetical protein